MRTGGSALGGAEAEGADDEGAWEGADADVLVAVGGDDVFFVWRESERREERSMAEHERAVRQIFVRSQRAALRGTRRSRSERVRVGMERVTFGWDERRLGAGCEGEIDLKTSPNLSLTTIFAPSRVKHTSVGFLGSSLVWGDVWARKEE